MEVLFVMAERILGKRCGVLPRYGKDMELVKGSDKGDAPAENVSGIGLSRDDFFQGSVRMRHETPRHGCVCV